MPELKSHNVAYQPLGSSPPPSTMLINDQLIEDDDDTAIGGRSGSSYDHDQRSNASMFRFSHTLASLARNPRFNERQLRTALLIVATVLFLTFLAQLISNHKRFERKFRAPNLGDIDISASNSVMSSEASSKANQNQSARQSHINPTHSTRFKYQNHPKHKFDSRMIDTDSAFLSHSRPKYDSYLTSVLRDHGSLSDHLDIASLDDLLDPEESKLIQKRAPWWKVTYRLGGEYLVLENYIRATKSFSENSSVTLTTQATIDFMHHTVELCKRWDGPISVALFAPGIEFSIALTMIKFLRQCLPEPINACIRDKVTWHLAYTKNHGPPAIAIGFPRYHLDELHYPLFVQTGQCPKLFSGPGEADLVKTFEEQMRKKNQIHPQSYREQFRLTYPINVLRNSARRTAFTKYVLASDIELYPSAKLVPQFIAMLRNHNLQLEYPEVERFVFALPIFEVKINITTPPKTKEDLLKLVRRGDAIFFHKYVCDACQDFPDRTRWLESNVLEERQYHNHEQSDDELVIFKVTKRDKKRQFWEPIFIGTKEDPEYDDRLSWDGRRDKMGQMYEMCLRGYHIFILGNAFLVHAPGIKHLDMNDFSSRLDFIKQNNAIYDATIEKLKAQYSSSEQIKTC